MFASGYLTQSPLNKWDGGGDLSHGKVVGVTMLSSLYLAYISDGVLVTHYALPNGLSFLGRSAPCEIVLPDWTVSQKHARVHVKNNEVMVTDLNSHNGTFLEGQPIRSGKIAPGQEIRFGNYRLVLFEKHRLPATDGLEQKTHDAQSHIERPNLPLEPLTPAQRRVLELLLQAKTERAIAKILELSERTIHNHIQAIYKAYSVHKKVDLILHLLPKVDQTVILRDKHVTDQ